MLKRTGDRRVIERRAPVRGSTIRIGDKDYHHKRIRMAEYEMQRRRASELAR